MMLIFFTPEREERFIEEKKNDITRRENSIALRSTSMLLWQQDAMVHDLRPTG